MPNDQQVVTGEINFADETLPFSGAVLNVRLEDISLADAPARTISWQHMREVSYEEGAIPFSLAANGYDDRARYNVSVHISLHGGDDIRPGDFITMQAYPVLTFGNPDHVVVEVRKI